MPKDIMLLSGDATKRVVEDMVFEIIVELITSDRGCTFPWA
jgi:hypothetical protein